MNRRQKNGLMLMVLGLLLLLGGFFLHYTQSRQDQLAGENAQILLQQLELNKFTVTPPVLPVLPEQTPELPEAPSAPKPMAEKEYLGYSMIGTVRVPDLGIELPVLSSWSYELLNVAPCRYSGSIPEENMILMGHNYRSHFTPLHRAEVGMAVEFEDVNGILYRYTIAQIQFLHKSQGEKLPSEYPLSLFTCSANGQERIVIRCQKDPDQ